MADEPDKLKEDLSTEEQIDRLISEHTDLQDDLKPLEARAKEIEQELVRAGFKIVNFTKETKLPGAPFPGWEHPKSISLLWRSGKCLSITLYTEENVRIFQKKETTDEEWLEHLRYYHKYNEIQTLQSEKSLPWVFKKLSEEEWINFEKQRNRAALEQYAQDYKRKQARDNRNEHLKKLNKKPWESKR